MPVVTISTMYIHKLIHIIQLQGKIPLKTKQQPQGTRKTRPLRLLRPERPARSCVINQLRIGKKIGFLDANDLQVQVIFDEIDAFFLPIKPKSDNLLFNFYIYCFVTS